MGQITDVPANVWLELYVDADFAGDSDSALRLAGRDVDLIIYEDNEATEKEGCTSRV